MYDFDGASKKFKEAYERAVRDIEDHNYANLSMVWNDDFWNKLFSGQNCAEKKRYDLAGDLMVWNNDPEREFTVLDYVAEERSDLVGDINAFLSSRAQGGSLIVHVLVNKDCLREKYLTPEILKLTDDNGWSVAHLLADKGLLPESCITPEILTFETEYKSAVIFDLIKSNTLPEKFISSPERGISSEFLTPEILNMRGDYGWSVAHALASKDKLPEILITPEILKLADINNLTVAHVLAGRDKLPENLITPEILKLTEDRNCGNSVADILAARNRLPGKFITPEILRSLLISDSLKSNTVVADLFLERDKCPPEFWTPEIFSNRTFTSRLSFILSRKSAEDRISFASTLSTESLNFILSSEEIRNLDNSDILINAAKTVVEKTTEQEAFENVSVDGNWSNDLPDLYGPSSPSCSSLEEAKDLILSGGSDREAGIDYLNEKFGEVMAKPMIEEITKEEKKKEVKDKTSPDRER